MIYKYYDYILHNGITYFWCMPKKLHRIKEVLKENDKSGYWLAKETEISYNSINGYVNGKIEPSLTNLFRIAEALKVNARDLINS
jgi:putative transcriptional regulator